MAVSKELSQGTPGIPQISPAVSRETVRPQGGEWGELVGLLGPKQSDLELALAQATLLVQLLEEKRYPVAVIMAKAHLAVLQQASSIAEVSQRLADVTTPAAGRRAKD